MMPLIFLVFSVLYWVLFLGTSAIWRVPMALRKERHLMLQDGRWFYQRKIPLAALEQFGGKKKLKIPLYTANVAEANQRWIAVHTEVETMFASAINLSVAGPRLIREIDDEKINSLLVAQQVDFAGMPLRGKMMDMMYPELRQPPEKKGVPAQFFDRAIRMIEIRYGWKFEEPLVETLRTKFGYLTDALHHERFDDQSWRVVNDVLKTEQSRRPSAAGMGFPAPTARQKVVTLSELMKQFNSDPARRELAQSSLSSSTAAFAILTDVLGPGCDIRTISRSDVKRVRDIIQWLPVSCQRLPEYKGKPFAQIAEEAEAKADRAKSRLEEAGIDATEVTEELLDEVGAPKFLKRSAVNKYLGCISQLFEWATNDMLLAATPAANLKLRSTGESEKREFTGEALTRLFHKDYVLNPLTWIPLVCLYQGFRPGECCQLDATDFAIVDGIDCLQITVERRNKSVDARLRLTRNDTDKSNKNKSSRRTIPLHRRLVELGFADYARGRQDSAERKLFDVTKWDVAAGNGYYESARKRLVPMLKAAGVYTPTTTLHSFRHTFALALRQAAPTEQQIREAIGGWSVGGSAEIDYGSAAFSPSVLKPWLDKVEFDGLFTQPPPAD
jgi:integrase